MMDKNRKILLMDILQGAVVIFLVGWLCYRNLIASLAGMVVLPIFIRFKTKKRVNQRQTRLWKEFKDVTAMMYSSTAAGGTLEKALRDVRKDMLVSAGRYQVLLPEFEKICIQLDRNISVETVLNDFADRCNDKDILYFVKILNIARKSGGALSDIIRHTSDTMNLRMEINSEIDTLLAGEKRRMESHADRTAGNSDLYEFVLCGLYVSALYNINRKNSNDGGTGIIWYCHVDRL